MDQKQLESELVFNAVRSSGSGGQHVNKVATKIELRWDLKNSTAFSEEEKNQLKTKLANRISKENILTISCEESRSQYQNKELAKKRLVELLEVSLLKPKKRKKTKPGIIAQQKRLKHKRLNAEKKYDRKKINLSD